MGCGSSLPKNTGPVGISPQLKKLLVGGGEDAEGSPPSSIDLASEEYRNAKAVDGQLWGELIRAGYVHLYYNHDTCNKINVFPIPDGDTGTNMIITLRNAITALGSSPEKDIKQLVQQIAGLTTLNAQGNSGTIFSFFFGKVSTLVSEAKQDDGSLDLRTFATILTKVGEDMYGAMEKPMPGTMLSVIKDTFSEDALSGANTMEGLIRNACEAGQTSLQKTPDQLIVDGVKVLKNFRGKTVVDSGAQGFLYLIEGMVSALDGTLKYGEYLESGTAADVALDEGVMGGDEVKGDGHETSDVDSIKFKYCTECVAELRNGVTQEDLRKELMAPYTDGKYGVLGDSLGTLITKMSDDVALAKIHIHSNKPDEVFNRVNKFTKDGHLYKEKAEDMRLQVLRSQNKRSLPPKNDGVKVKTGLLWGSTAGLPEDYINAYKEGWVPFTTVIDSASYKDRVTVTPLAAFNISRRKDFYKMGTSGWNPDDVKATLKVLLEKYEEIVCITLSWEASKGTGNALNKAIDDIDSEDSSINARGRVFAWQHMGFFALEAGCVMRTHWLANQGLGANEIIAKLKEWQVRKDTFFFAYIPRFTAVRKGGRLAPIDKGIVKMVINYAESKGMGVASVADCIKPDPKAPYAAKGQSLGLGTPEKMRNAGGKIPKGLIKFATKAGAPVYDVILNHAAAPHHMEDLLNELQAAPSFKIRNVYLAEVSSLMASQIGHDMLQGFFWPADEMEFIERD